MKNKKFTFKASGFIFVIILMLHITTSTTYAEFTYDGYTYTVSGNTATITGNTGLEGSITIPSIIRTIGVSAFSCFYFIPAIFQIMNNNRYFSSEGI